MEVYVKESLHVLDYENKIKDTLFLSDDRMTPGYAYDIDIKEANTGYSDLTFKIPNTIITDNGDQIKNPKLALLTPLVKLRYNREVYYTGSKPIKVREPIGAGDKLEYIDVEYSNVYPHNIIENYVMDYIVQPVDKKRNGLEIATTFTAMDYPRFTLSKKRVGLTISQDTLTREEWSLYEDKPMDVPGTIKYEPWDDSFSKYSKITEWDPEHADAYPLDQAAIEELIKDTEKWSYGMLGTAFYWPIVSTARFEGTMYVKGGFLVLQLYDFYALTTEGISPEHHVDRWSWDWTQLYEVDNYLTPNRADNYLAHILEGTGWEVGEVDIVKVDIPNPAGSTDQTTKTDMTCNIDISGGNCYNAITAVCQGLQLYPVFDCLNKKVSLKTFVGKNYGLVYRVGSNITSTGVKQDGEKIITKLYVSGGKDYNGDENINIGEAERSYFEPTDNPDEREPWNPNAPEYIIKRSPYGTNYILNFKWMFDNKWMTKEQILGLYNINQQINDLNKGFMPSYTEDRRNVLQQYNDAINQYDLKQGEYQSILNSMMNKYYKVDGQYSKGTFYAFHTAPLGVHKNDDGKNYLWINHCFDCGETNAADGDTAPTVCSHCKSTNIQVDELYIPVYKDFDDVVPPTVDPLPYGPSCPGFEYAPHLKGDYLKLITTLDNSGGSKDEYDIKFYEKNISLIEPIDYTSAPIDGYTYVIAGIKVRASSSNIDEWNEDIAGFVKAYGEMIDALAIVNYCLEKIKELEQAYADWKAQSDKLHEDIQKEYGDYIIEGNYKNDEQPYVGLLFNEGMEASDKYAVPEITYNLDVIDSSGLIEYRQPWATTYVCGDCGYENHVNPNECPGCKSKNLIKVHDTYNDLVRMLHSVGQIVPKAGDYVIVYDEQMGLYGVPALITDITRYPDNPLKNSIKLDTSYTDDEELVGNIINATNTVLSNKDIYARTAVLKSDGTIDNETISKTLDNPNANVSIVGTDGNMLLTGSYLRFTNPTDDTRAMKYSGTGVFSTTTYTENGEGTMWERLMTPYGINATYINAGTIDTKNINILSGTSSKILMDQYGLSIKNNGKNSVHITSFDSDAATKNANYASKWGTDNNIAAFIGVDPDNNSLIYTKGFLVAEEGSNIANWITSDSGFYHLSGTTKDLWLSPGGINGTVNNNNKNFAIYAGGKFGVTTGGVMYATEANINGILLANSGSKIGPWNITDSSIWYGNASYGNASGIYLGTSGLSIGNKFKVDNSGKLTATDANITGTISASSLTLTGSATIDAAKVSGTLSAATISGNNISGGTITGTTISGNTISGGSVSGTSIYGSGFYCGWNDTEQSYRTQLLSNGIFKYYNGVGFLVCGYASGGNDNKTKHPYVSGLNVARGAGGIGFWTGGYMTDLGSLQAYVNLDSNNVLNIYGSKGVDFASGQNMNISAGDALGIDPWTYCAIRTGDATVTPSSKSIYLKCGSGGTGNITLYTDYGSVYAKGNGLSNAKVLTDQGSASSKNVKENIEPFTNEKYDNALKLLSNINIYSYDYKYGLYSNHPHQYGFLIDEIEEQNGYSDFFNFHEEKGFVQDGFINHNMDDWKKGAQIIKLKKYDTDVLDKYLLTCVKALQNKIDELQQEIEQIKKEKE